jgi:hypothetical protein
LFCGYKDQQSVVGHQHEKHQFEKISDDSKGPQQLGGKHGIDKRKTDMSAMVFRNTRTE